MATVLERITINNILAFIVIVAYCGMWSWMVYYGTTHYVDSGTEPVIGIITIIKDFSAVISTMTVIVVLVIQFYFRTAKTPDPPETIS